MPYSHHSHSGSYCKHAHDTLDSVVKTAYDKKFKIFCLTEHVPRLDDEYMYPEELELNMTPKLLKDQFDDFVKHARHLQEKYNYNKNDNNNFKILIGFESEGGINDEHLNMCVKLRDEIKAEIVVGSVHHVNGIDIDFDQETWNYALEKNGGLKGLYKEYFKLVYKMIKILKPSVVAHFDLIRLFANVVNDQNVKTTREEQLGISIKDDWPDIWEIINNAIDLIIENNLTVELNSSAIRKGWDTPYPKDDLMNLMIEKGVKFVLSDDSHGDDQVGLNYHIVLQYIKKLNIKEVWFYNFQDIGKVVLEPVLVEDLINDEFWPLNYPSL